MSSLFSELRARIDTPPRRKFIRYSLVSVISVGVTVTVQMFCYGILLLSGGWSAIVASSIAAFPSYLLNRGWVWGKKGRSHLMKEVVPFWSMAFIGLGFSTFCSSMADRIAHDVTEVHLFRTLIVTMSSIVAFGTLWVLKFIIFNKILFAHRDQELDPALDGRSGIPT